LALTVEISDWTRFTGASISADVGLLSCEYTSAHIPAPAQPGI
jgi:hypothetical protein